MLEEWGALYEKKEYYHWAITLKENGPEPIGSIAAVKQDDRIGMVQIGYCIGRRWWKRGITAEALSALIQFFFEEVKANRIEAKFDITHASPPTVALAAPLLGYFMPSQVAGRG